MKKIKGTERSSSSVREMLPEYRFNYGKARSNRFQRKVSRGRVLISIDSDVAQVFATDEAVNNALRAFISAMPSVARKKVPHK